jgi:hypothetical protein
MNAIQQLAISKAVKDAAAKIARSEVQAGEYPVDFTLKISGTVKVGEDSDKKSTCSIPYKAVMALMVQRMGFQREKAIAIVEECVGEAIKQSLAKGDAATSEGSLDAELEEIYTRLVDKACESLPRTPVSGQVKATLQLEMI